MDLKVCFLRAVRRRTFICCRNVRISASSAARDRNRSATIQTMSLTRSLILQQHRPILDQLLVRLSLRQGQVPAGDVSARNRRFTRFCPPRRLGKSNSLGHLRHAPYPNEGETFPPASKPILCVLREQVARRPGIVARRNVRSVVPRYTSYAIVLTLLPIE
jgi:hypothetical protein